MMPHDPVTWSPFGLSFDVFAALTIFVISQFFYWTLRWLSEYIAVFGSALIALSAHAIGLITWMTFLLILLSLLGLLSYFGYWQQRRR